MPLRVKVKKESSRVQRPLACKGFWLVLSNYWTKLPSSTLVLHNCPESSFVSQPLLVGQPPNAFLSTVRLNIHLDVHWPLLFSSWQLLIWDVTRVALASKEKGLLVTFLRLSTGVPLLLKTFYSMPFVVCVIYRYLFLCIYDLCIYHFSISLSSIVWVFSRAFAYEHIHFPPFILGF